MLLLTSSASTCLQHSRNLGTALYYEPCSIDWIDAYSIHTEHPKYTLLYAVRTRMAHVTAPSSAPQSEGRSSSSSAILHDAAIHGKLILSNGRTAELVFRERDGIGKDRG